MIFINESAVTAKRCGGEVMTEDGMIHFEQRECAAWAVIFKSGKTVDGMTVHVVDEIHPRVEGDVTQTWFE
jgi:hypothetical protein